MSDEIEKYDGSRPAVEISERGIQLRTLDDAWRFATYVSKAGLAPKGMSRPEQVVVAIQAGMEAGLSPMKALQSIVVINGAPSWKGDSARALVNRSGLLRKGTTVRTWTEGEGEQMVGHCETLRADAKTPEQTSFSVDDAKLAGLWRKDGPWKQYPKRMLQYRAMGFHLRDHFPEVMLGFYIADEAQDVPQAREINVTPQISTPASAEPPAWARGAQAVPEPQALPAPPALEPEIVPASEDARRSHEPQASTPADAPPAPEPSLAESALGPQTPTPEVGEDEEPADAYDDAKLELLAQLAETIDTRAEAFKDLVPDIGAVRDGLRRSVLERFECERFGDLPLPRLKAAISFAVNAKPASA